MIYNRIIEENIVKSLFKGKISIIVGARQIGKTTLARKIVKKFPSKEVRFFNADNPSDRELLSDRDFEFLNRLIGKAEIIFIDEGQKVATIGQTLKLLVDEYKNKKQIIVTGSSSFNLLDKTEEPLTGRKRVFYLFPLSLEEIYPKKNMLEISKELEQHMIFGSYPEVVNEKTFDEKIKALQEIASSYLYKDVLEFQGIKKSDALIKLVKALALQVGSEVSYTELANLTGLNKKTVESYVDILEKNNIVFRLAPHATNKRKMISKLRKVYFWDTGIRNAIIGNFNFFDTRNDKGSLWKNFILVERMKFQAYRNVITTNHFLRTYDGAEIDLLEEIGGEIHGYEFKLGKNKTKKEGSIGGIKYKTITPENISNFIF